MIFYLCVCVYVFRGISGLEVGSVVIMVEFPGCRKEK